MRNTVEYPITKDEIAEYLQFLIEMLDYAQTGAVGSMGPLLLSKAKEIVLAYEGDLQEIPHAKDGGQ